MSKSLFWPAMALAMAVAYVFTMYVMSSVRTPLTVCPTVPKVEVWVPTPKGTWRLQADTYLDRTVEPPKEHYLDLEMKEINRRIDSHETRLDRHRERLDELQQKKCK